MAQGVPWGFVGVAYVVFLSDQGLDKTTIGNVISWAYLPWLYKWTAGLFIDRFPSRRFGRRRHFILSAELLMGLALLALPFFDPKLHLAWINAALFAHNLFAAIQDVATDGLAVDVLPEHERGRANAVMWAAKGGGSALGGGLQNTAEAATNDRPERQDLGGIATKACCTERRALSVPDLLVLFETP